MLHMMKKSLLRFYSLTLYKLQLYEENRDSSLYTEWNTQTVKQIKYIYL